MRRLVIGVMAGMMFPLYSAHADIQTDLKTDKPMTVVFENASKEGISTLNTLGQVIDARFDLAGSAICTALGKDAGSAQQITNLALDKNVSPTNIATSASQCAPGSAQDVFAAMRAAGVSEEDMTAAAFDAGLDPTQVLEATAAGPGSSQPGLGGSSTGSRISPPPFGSNAGGGGGSNGSPS